MGPRDGEEEHEVEESLKREVSCFRSKRDSSEEEWRDGDGSQINPRRLSLQF
jgi:hypothetical protein